MSPGALDSSCPVSVGVEWDTTTARAVAIGATNQLTYKRTPRWAMLILVESAVIAPCDGLLALSVVASP